jgi:hypothetical protein
MALTIREYFREARDYKIYWMAAAFRSNVGVVRGGATPLIFGNGKKVIAENGTSANDGLGGNCPLIVIQEGSAVFCRTFESYPLLAQS